MAKNIVLGVTGGIAAYKSANIVSMLKKKGYNVNVIMTKNATEIITPLALETLSKNKVVVDMWEKKNHTDVEHISLAENADLVLVAPATYNIVGKVANGIADDMLSTVISATKAPVYFALAMNVNMYENPILLENMRKLEKYGYKFIEADEGFLACNVNAKGRLKNEEQIVELVDKALRKDRSLAGKKVLITAGRTEESIDPIRYLSNRSTGTMGYALAEAAADLGAEVTLVSGPTNLVPPSGVKFVAVKSAREMYDAVIERFDSQDIAVACAAVADYRVKEYSQQKIKKGDGELILELTRNPDILLEMGKRKNKQILVGFAAESENLEENAKKKLEKKNLDMIVANSVKYFESSSNEVTFLYRDGNSENIPEMSKKNLAYEIMARFETLKK